MYLECRHILPSGRRCNSPAVDKGHWCYYHARLHRLQDEQRVAWTRHSQRLPNGRFAPASGLGPASSAASHDRPHHPRPHASRAGSPAPQGPAGTALALIPPPSGEPYPELAPDLPTQTPHTKTIDRGLYPVPDPPAPEPAPDTLPLALPLVEDNASLQLALIQVTQAIAQNQIDTKRASLLLYALQIAAQNVRHKHVAFTSVRSVTYTDNGAPLAGQQYGYDIEDMDDEDDED